jgi:uncharacterized delta-60 repeat protein
MGSYINCCLILNDKKILIGGAFSSYHGVPVYNLARLNSDGTLDNSFNTSIEENSEIISIAQQNDGKILILERQIMNSIFSECKITRLNYNGTIDSSFRYESDAKFYYYFALQLDGKILIKETFFNFSDDSVNNVKNGSYIKRLNANGTQDNSFKIIRLGEYENVSTISIQQDGKILIGGKFSFYQDSVNYCIARFNINGGLDSSYILVKAKDDEVLTIALQPDKKILIGGNFTNFNQTERKYIIRLNSNGSIDNNFNSNVLFSPVNSINLQSANKILIVLEYPLCGLN